ncbi:MAG: DUF5696 domain-containing protein [Zhenhengia sp.]|uniref:DUF5696 domain-containing protein n=1 Tax=Zhenhengia sp. TaxID=2944208 RepID=UPI003992C435
MKKIARLILLIGIVLSLSACATEEVETELPEELIKPNTTAFSEDADIYQTIVENEYLSLAYCEESAQFKIINQKDGSEFYTMTSEPAVNAEKSLFEIYYMDDKNNFSRMYSYSDSVAKGQYQTELIDNGLKIAFTLGEVEQNVFCPPAISKERFEAIVEKIDKQFDKIRFKQSYFLPNLDKLSEDKKADLFKKYPKLETEELYVLTQSNLPSSVQKEISGILEATGYTEEDYAIDMENAGELKQGGSAIFHLNMYVTLEEDQLKVRIPIEEIMEVNGGKILTLSLLENFASPEYGQEGNFLLPDGAGSLMNFYNGNGELTTFKVPIYGADKAIPVQEQIFKAEQAYLPIYGVQYEDKGMLATISDGEAFAEIHAQPGSDITHATAYPIFNVRRNAKAYLQGSQNGAEAFIFLQKQLYDGDLEVTYHFFDESNNSLGDMATYYGNELFGEKEGIEEPLIYLEFIGAAYNEEGEYSLGSRELETFTTIAQVRSIVEELVEEGVDPLSVKLLGFGEHGLDCSAINSFKLNKELGTQQELEDFSAWAKANNVELYIDVDPQYVYTTGFGDHFTKTKDATYTITNKYGENYPYLPNTLQLNEVKKGSYILNPLAVSEVIAKNNEAIQEIDGVGISLRDLGSHLNSDFTKKRPIDRQNALKRLVQDMTNISNGEEGIVVNGANAAILPYVRHVSRVAVDKPQFDNADHSIAFLQMVLSGRVGYSDIPVNLSSNSEKFMMQGIGVGTGFTYVLTGEPNKSLRKTTHPEYYSTAYDVWKEDILVKAEALEERSQYIEGNITGYEVIDKDVYKVSYSNGGWILCNGSDLPYTYGGNTLQPYTYMMGGTGNER